MYDTLAQKLISDLPIALMHFRSAAYFKKYIRYGKS